MKNNENQSIWGFSTFHMTYAFGWVLILLRASGIIAISWRAIGMYYLILAFATCIVFTIAAVIALLGGYHE
ncbi:hypothetical protein [Lacticaseibacillus parakribbianus]|uniref:hypothetical protein n=1 Tax=Lacticaseibacillus parakribbianus TaxID=2970927 RepID=UPI0021CB08D8|nr:hypothetical protein [Lacticaseibacillus parakribbianus]